MRFILFTMIIKRIIIQQQNDLSSKQLDAGKFLFVLKTYFS